MEVDFVFLNGWERFARFFVFFDCSFVTDGFRNFEKVVVMSRYYLRVIEMVLGGLERRLRYFIWGVGFT